MICSEPQRLTTIEGSDLGQSDGGPVPASLLLISATGASRPALLLALDRDGLSVRREAPAQSVGTVDDADVVVIDATESATAGIDTLVSVRRQSGVPVVFVAGAGSGPEAVLALDLGADDFVIEPFVHGEVPARIRSVLRRCRRPERPAPLTFGRLSVLAGRAGGPRRRRGHRDHAPGVRPARPPRRRTPACLLPDGTARGGLGIVRCLAEPGHRHRAHPSPAAEAGVRPGSSPLAPHGPGRRLPLRPMSITCPPPSPLAAPTSISPRPGCRSGRSWRPPSGRPSPRWRCSRPSAASCGPTPPCAGCSVARSPSSSGWRWRTSPTPTIERRSSPRSRTPARGCCGAFASGPGRSAPTGGHPHARRHDDAAGRDR